MCVWILLAGSNSTREGARNNHLSPLHLQHPILSFHQAKMTRLHFSLLLLALCSGLSDVLCSPAAPASRNETVTASRNIASFVDSTIHQSQAHKMIAGGGVNLALNPPKGPVSLSADKKTNDKLGDGSTLNSTYSFLYGKVSLTVAASDVPGAVVALVLFGTTTADEIDIEILGGDPTTGKPMSSDLPQERLNRFTVYLVVSTGTQMAELLVERTHTPSTGAHEESPGQSMGNPSDICHQSKPSTMVNNITPQPAPASSSDYGTPVAPREPATGHTAQYHGQTSAKSGDRLDQVNHCRMSLLAL
ncbi:hypothetical protein H4Q26_012885 [Puccinia striiformis f. sp. tritici PST-130]|nr:hypothetical protein H4Q26_012885 [Puccinia striiformis f. sp. tritici PST-130]